MTFSTHSPSPLSSNHTASQLPLTPAIDYLKNNRFKGSLEVVSLKLNKTLTFSNKIFNEKVKSHHLVEVINQTNVILTNLTTIKHSLNDKSKIHWCVLYFFSQALNQWCKAKSLNNFLNKISTLTKNNDINEIMVKISDSQLKISKQFNKVKSVKKMSQKNSIEESQKQIDATLIDENLLKTSKKIIKESLIHLKIRDAVRKRIMEDIADHKFHLAYNKTARNC